MDGQFTIFMGIWVTLALVGAYLFGINRNAVLKRRLFPWFVVLAGVFMLGFTFVTIGFAWRTLAFAGPAIALITYLNIRFTQFCPRCGRTIVNRGAWFSQSEYCSYCGAKLDE